MLPLHQAIYLPFDFYGKIKFGHLSGKISITGPIHRALIKVGSQGSEMFGDVLNIVDIAGNWNINGTFVIGTGSLIRIEKEANFITKNNVVLGAHNIVFVENNVVINEDFLSSWKCQILDSDRHVIIDCLSKEESVKSSPIYVGKHVWIGNNVSVNKGTKIPSNTIIASHSLCTKDYSLFGEFNILGGYPVKILSNNKQWKEK